MSFLPKRKKLLQENDIDDTEDSDYPPLHQLFKKLPRITVLAPSEQQSCPHYFGYIANWDKNDPFPDNCLICPKLLKCMVK